MSETYLHINREYRDGSFDATEMFTCECCQGEYEVEGNMNHNLYEEKGDTFCLTCALPHKYEKRDDGTYHLHPISEANYSKILKEFYGVGICGCCHDEFKLEHLKPYAVEHKNLMVCPACYQHRLQLNPAPQLRLTKVFRLPPKNSPRPLVKADEARVY